MNCPENPIFYFKKPRFGVEVLGVQTNQSKVREISWTSQKIKHLKKKPVGGWNFRGQHFKSSGNFMNCWENRCIFLTPPPPVGRFRSKTWSIKLNKISRECSYPERWRSRVIRGLWEGGADGREGTGREKGIGRQAGKEGPERSRVTS